MNTRCSSYLLFFKMASSCHFLRSSSSSVSSFKMVSLIFFRVILMRYRILDRSAWLLTMSPFSVFSNKLCCFLAKMALFLTSRNFKSLISLMASLILTYPSQNWGLDGTRDLHRDSLVLRNFLYWAAYFHCLKVFKIVNFLNTGKFENICLLIPSRTKLSWEM